MTDIRLTSSNIIKLLSARHADDIFVPECKNGPTHTANHLRMDAWAMKKSWSSPRYVGYEIKVSRSDFLKDDKWPGYLPYCTEFYFACPYQMIQPEELPQDIGLIWVSKTGTRLFTKRKAAIRKVSIPDEIFRYVLMSRADINNGYSNKLSKREFWQKWLEEKKIDREFGYMVSRSIAKNYQKHVKQVEEENSRLKHENERLENIKQCVSELGFNPMRSVQTWQIESRITELINGVPGEFKSAVKSVLNGLQVISENIDKVK